MFLCVNGTVCDYCNDSCRESAQPLKLFVEAMQTSIYEISHFWRITNHLETQDGLILLPYHSYYLLNSEVNVQMQ